MTKEITIIEPANNGGYGIFRADQWGHEKVLQGVAKDREDVASYFHAVSVRPEPNMFARRLVDCFNDGQPIRKRISMIKVVRDATGCGLKEGKEAVERAIADRYL